MLSTTPFRSHRKSVISGFLSLRKQNALFSSKRFYSANPAFFSHQKIPILEDKDPNYTPFRQQIFSHLNQDKPDYPLIRSENFVPFDPENKALVFTGSSNRALAKSICRGLGKKLNDCHNRRYTDGEFQIQFNESIRGKNVYLIQPTCPPVNESIIELLLMISTCRRASANNITAVIPYYGYARQDRKSNSRVPISSADVARMLTAMGVDRCLLLDLHSSQTQGFFPRSVPVDVLEGCVVGMDYFKNNIKLERPIVVSPDAGGTRNARVFQEGLCRRGIPTSLGVITKQRLEANKIARMDFVGNAQGRDAIIVDDMIDTGGTLAKAAITLKENGARKIFAFATHGLLSGKAVDILNESPLEEIVVTDSISLVENVSQCPKVKRVGVGNLIAEGIRRIHNKETMEPLYEKSFDRSTRVVKMPINSQ